LSGVFQKNILSLTETNEKIKDPLKPSSSRLREIFEILHFWNVFLVRDSTIPFKGWAKKGFVP